MQNSLEASAKSLRKGDSTDCKWLYNECMKVLERGDSYTTLKIDRSLIKAGRALNSAGEYILAAEIFERLLERTRIANEVKLQLDSIEGLAIAQFHIGDHDRSYGLLEEGTRLATQVRNDKWMVLFARMKAEFVSTLAQKF